MYNLPKRDAQTRDEYIQELCLKTGVTPEDVEKALDVTPCYCGCVVCTGWLAQPKGMNWATPKPGGKNEDNAS